jgi:hypothetical protein
VERKSELNDDDYDDDDTIMMMMMLDDDDNREITTTERESILLIFSQNMRFEQPRFRSLKIYILKKINILIV